MSSEAEFESTEYIKPDVNEPLWSPHAGGQDEGLQCPVYELLARGNRGGGKSALLTNDFLQHCGPVKWEGHQAGYGTKWRGVIFRRILDELSGIIAESIDWIPRLFPDAKFYAAKPPHWRFATGEILMFRQLEKISDFLKFKGQPIPWLGYDELTNWPSPDLYLQMMSCSRSVVPGMPAKVRSTSNPDGPGHGWVKERFQLHGIRKEDMWGPLIEEPGKRSRISISIPLSENLTLLKGTPDYEDVIRMSARNDAQLQAWLYEDWDAVSGGMFSDVWNADKHVVPNFEITGNWRIDRSFDWGSAHPFSVGWWAESDGSDMKGPDGNWYSTVRGDIFRIAEWYGWNGKANQGCHMLAVDIAAGIVEREILWGIHGRVQPGPADNQIWKVENGMCIANDMSKPVRIGNRVYDGVRWTRSDKRPYSRVPGWELFRTMLSNTGRNWKGPRERAGLFVCERCEHFRRTIPVLPRLDIQPDDVDKSSEDHIADEARYRLRGMGSHLISGTTSGVPG